MKIAVDLHSHSGYAGGTKNISLEGLASSMILKGIDVLGTGDCLFPVWQRRCRGNIYYRLTTKNLLWLKD